jgi:hypothetical protein
VKVATKNLKNEHLSTQSVKENMVYAYIFKAPSSPDLIKDWCLIRMMMMKPFFCILASQINLSSKKIFCGC